MKLVQTAAGVGRLEGESIALLAAPDMLDWLRGEGRGETGDVLALADTKLLAPVRRPPSFRDFFAYEEHAATGARLRGRSLPEAWYEAPVFYFSNPASIHGPGDAIPRPAGCERLDFELEIGAVIGVAGGIAGFTLLNDWSARDIQRREMEVGLGPHKGKDFATSLGPWLVTPDELPYRDGRLHLQGRALLNGVVLTESDASAMHFSWDRLLEHAALNTRGLEPGDVLGSGTLGRGCLLELNAADGAEPRWLADGDELVIEADGLGSLLGRITP